jgi:BCD family chlorophyll transporter-like MFS transporter
VPANKSVSLVAQFDAAGDPKLGVFVNDISTIPAGQGRLTVRHTAEAGAVAIVANGAIAFDDVKNGDEGKTLLPVGGITAGVAGKLLDPFSPMRLIAVTGGVSLFAFLLACLALIGLERGARAPVAHEGERPAFSAVLREVWADPAARRFTIFVFISMLAYSAADLVLEPFAGEVFGRSIGQSTALAGMQNGGTLAGMIVMAIFGSGIFGARLASLRGWMFMGCLASAAALVALAMAAELQAAVSLETLYILLGLANGAFAASAIASMMQLAGSARTGTRMGLWGAAQAIAFALGGFGGTVVCDLARWMFGSAGHAYAAVFLGEAALFVLSALIATRLAVPRLPNLRMTPMKEAIS